MKVYPNLAKAVIASLGNIAAGGYADKIIETALKSNPKWGSRDRSFVASSVYEIVRWKRLYAHITGQDFNNPDPAQLATAHWILNGYETEEIDFLPKLRKSELKRRIKDINKVEIRESIPDWLGTVAKEQLGKDWEKEMIALNEEAKLVLRANTLKTDPVKLQAILKERGVETLSSKERPEALVAGKRSNVFRLEEYKLGLFEIQDKSSQEVAPFLKVEPGMRVIDACAGAGGKSLHLAALMQNKGRILSLDTEEYKLTELKRRAKRAGASIVETRVISSSKTIKRLAGQADRLLLDVPCSGLGVLRRNPDAKWKITPEFIEKVKATQQEILSRYEKMVKPGGVLVYATCSILPAENQEQVKKFLESAGPGFELEEERTILPSESGFDGFYMARIKKLK